MATSDYLLNIDDDADDNAAAVTKAQWQRYQELYTPLENQLLGSLDDNNSMQTANQAGEAYDRSTQSSARQLSRYGVTDPNASSTAHQAAIDRARAKGDAFNSSELARIDRRNNVRGSLIDAGQSLVNQATGGLSSSASAAQSRDNAYQQQKAAADQQENQMYSSLLATGLSAAAVSFL